MEHGKRFRFVTGFDYQWQSFEESNFIISSIYDAHATHLLAYYYLQQQQQLRLLVELTQYAKSSATVSIRIMVPFRDLHPTKHPEQSQSSKSAQC